MILPVSHPVARVVHISKICLSLSPSKNLSLTTINYQHTTYWTLNVLLNIFIYVFLTVIILTYFYHSNSNRTFLCKKYCNTFKPRFYIYNIYNINVNWIVSYLAFDRVFNLYNITVGKYMLSTLLHMIL